MKPLARCVAVLMTVGLLGCSSVGADCLDCAAGGSGGADSGAAGGTGGGPANIPDELFCGTTTRPLTSRSDDETCTFDLGPLPTNDGRVTYDAITIFADGQQLYRDPQHNDGWDYADASKMSIALYGPICQSIETGQVIDLVVAFTCLDV